MKKKLMVSKFGLHMASDPLAHGEISQESMAEIAKIFSKDSDLNGGSVQCALWQFIYTLLIQRADIEYLIDESQLGAIDEMCAGISKLAEEMSVRALQDMDATLNTFYDSKRSDHFETDMRARGRRFLKEEAARSLLLAQARENRIKFVANLRAKEGTPTQE